MLQVSVIPLSQGLLFTGVEQDNDEELLSMEPKACEEGVEPDCSFSLLHCTEDIKHLQDTWGVYYLFSLRSHSRAALMLGCFLTFYSRKVGGCL